MKIPVGIYYIGQVDKLDKESIRTKFYHVGYLPLIPTQSVYCTDQASGGFQSFEIPLNWKSILFGYLRWWLPMLAVLGIIIHAIGEAPQDYGLLAPFFIGLAFLTRWLGSLSPAEKRRRAVLLAETGVTGAPPRLQNSDMINNVLIKLKQNWESKTLGMSDVRNWEDIEIIEEIVPKLAGLAYTLAIYNGDRALAEQIWEMIDANWAQDYSTQMRDQKKDRSLLRNAMIAVAILATVVLYIYLAYKTAQIIHFTNVGITALENGDCQSAVKNASKTYQLYHNGPVFEELLQPIKQANDTIDYCRDYLKVINDTEDRDISVLIELIQKLEREPQPPEIYIENEVQLANREQRSRIVIGLIKEQILEIFEQRTEPTDLIRNSFCMRLKDLKEINVILDPDTNLPQIYVTCAQAFSSNIQDYRQVAWMYQQLLNEYPEHKLAIDADEKMAEILLARVQQQKQTDVAILPQPIVITEGKSDDNTVTVTFQNGSQFFLRIILIGDEVHFINLENCNICGDTNGCPQQAPIREEKLSAGEYQVIFEGTNFHGLNKPVKVIEMVGDWDLTQNEAYYICVDQIPE